MLVGLDQIATGQFSATRRRLRSSRVAVLTHSAATDRRGYTSLEALEELGGVAGCIASQGRELILEAHADDRGTVEYNILLTERRGRKVQQLLVDGGVPVELLKVLAKGSLEATGRDESGRSRDRRVAFIWPE